MRPLVLLAIAALLCAEAPADPARAMGEGLSLAFLAQLRDPAAYAREVERTCRRFPEGDLFPYTMPVLAWAARARDAQPDEAAILRTAMAACLERAIDATTRRAGAEDLSTLDDYRRHGTYLGQLALALGAWRLGGGDARWEPVHARLCAVLATALGEARGGPIASFPTATWPFDTIPPLLALRLRDVQQGTAVVDPLLAAHLAWIAQRGTDPTTGLPWSIVAPQRQPPRGCDLSWRIALLAQLDRGTARALWDLYRTAFWQERNGLAGLREWPAGVERAADPDSGAIVDGFGMSATGLGIGAALAVDDHAASARLAAQFLLVDLQRDRLAAALRTIGLRDDRHWRTGFLYGDVCLLYAATWRDWGVARDAAAR